MFFDSKRKEITIDEKIANASNRLKSASYEEDKIDALNNIKDLLKVNSHLVYNKCFLDIFSSLDSFEKLEMHLEIFNKMIESIDRSKIIQTICLEKKNATLISNLGGENINELLKLFYSDGLRDFLVENGVIFLIVRKLFEHEMYFYIYKFVESNRIANLLIFEGFIEILINKLYKSDEIYTIIQNLLKFTTCQNYFMESENLNIFIDNRRLKTRDFDVLGTILDPLNNNIKKYQNLIYNLACIAFEIKNYSFIIRLIYNNQHIFKQIIEDIIDFETLVLDADMDLDALHLLELILRYCKNNDAYNIARNSKSYRVQYLLLGLGFETGRNRNN